MQILIIDNYDSFTYNLYQLLAEQTDCFPQVVKNDAMTYEELLALQPDGIVISPGPGRPAYQSDMGLSREIIQRWEGPLLGVCLGHQGLVAAAGGTIVYAQEPMHGRLSTLHHKGDPMFAGIPPQFEVVRYHSLTAATPLPAELIPTAWTADGTLMALRHRQRPFWGVQYHPESIQTQYGEQLMRNFLNLVQEQTRRYQLLWKKLPTFPLPIQVYEQLIYPQPQHIWLDSSAPSHPDGRYSYMAAFQENTADIALRYSPENDQLLVNGLVTEAELFPYLQAVQEQFAIKQTDCPLPFQGGWLGEFHYEGAAQLLFCTRVYAWDHQAQTAYLLALCNAQTQSEAEQWLDDQSKALAALSDPVSLPVLSSVSPITVELTQSKEQYLQQIRACQQEIREGESYEICLTNQFETSSRPDPLTLYKHLRQGNPAPYAAILRWEEKWTLSSSPELFLEVDSDKHVQTKPIKGTIRRSPDPTLDQQLRQQLADSTKDRAENLMIVDLLRNDLGKVSVVGSVKVPRLMEIETYATVHQMVSTVESQLLPERQVFDCLAATFPGGSITGAPKIRTMEIISRLERHQRGVYTGSIGFFSVSGPSKVNIAIRTLRLDEQGVRFGSGGAITHLSEPEAEFEEILVKAFPMIRAIVSAQNGRFTPAQLELLGVSKTEFLAAVGSSVALSS